MIGKKALSADGCEEGDAYSNCPNLCAPATRDKLTLSCKGRPCGRKMRLVFVRLWECRSINTVHRAATWVEKKDEKDGY
jgi:hypothetical protein